MPAVSLRLVALLPSIARDRPRQVPDALGFAQGVADARPPSRTTVHRAQVARLLFLITSYAGDSAPRQRARSCGSARRWTRGSCRSRATNVFVHELAQHDLPRAERALRRMRRRDVGSDGVVLGSVAMAASPIDETGLGILTEKGRYDVLPTFSHAGDEDVRARFGRWAIWR